MNSPETRVRILKNRMEFQNIRRKTVAAGFPELKKLYYSAYADFLVTLAEHPWHTEETMELLKQEVAAYLKEKDRARPGILLLPKFAYVCLADAARLMRRIKPMENSADMEQLYP